MDTDPVKANPQSLEAKAVGAELGSTSTALPEPWLRGTLGEMPAVARAVLHALELAREDVRRWAGPLSEVQLKMRPGGLPAVAFQMRHIGRSVDRLLTYAEGGALSAEQLSALKTESDEDVVRTRLFAEFDEIVGRGMTRVRALAREDLEQPRFVGKKRLPSSLGGLLVHVAEHTQRHVGQLITTAKIAAANDESE
ncbi:MAG TPA: DinB family protein [Candidatus Dormibacteraeota bacterium]|nr:DinB family protein [Candidatus Dormibacteraeota bacterium]